MAVLAGSTQSGMPSPPSRSASFQKMLELEKKYKLERLRSSAPVQRAHNPSLTSTSSSSRPLSYSRPTQPSPPPEHRAQPHGLANGSFSQEQNMVLLEAVRRSIALPSLSISVPPHPNVSKAAGTAKSAKPAKPATKAPPPKSHLRTESKAELSKEVVKATKETKTVTFLAPDDDNLRDRVPSSQSSPTPEGYKEPAKKKEEKKEEKRQKEQAAKDAKAAKKRHTARLSKAPPPNHPASKESGHKPGHKSATEPLGIEYRPHDDENTGDVQHALAKLTGQPFHLIGRKPPSRDDGFVGGVKLAREREEIEIRLAELRQQEKLEPHDDHSKKLRAQKAFSIGPGAVPKMGQNTAISPADIANKRKEVSRPPITMHPIFRHNRSNSTPAADVTSTNMSTPILVSQTSGSFPESRGRPTSSQSSTSYVRSSRAQSSERAISGYKDEYKVGFFARLRGSSQPPKERVKLESPKVSSESYRRSTQLPPTPVTPARKPARPKAASPSVQVNSSPQPVDGAAGAATDYPSPPRISSPAGSDASSPRSSFKSITPPHNHSAPNGRTSPTFSFTSNMTSYFEYHPVDLSLCGSPEPRSSSSPAPRSSKFYLPEVTRTPPLFSQFSQAALFSQPTAATQSTGNIHVTVTKADGQPESRASERSSSSSYAGSHETSPPESPVSTPDTSRPQSQKGGSPTFGEVSRGNAANLVVQTDKRAMRNSSHGVSVSADANQDDIKSGSSQAAQDSKVALRKKALPVDIDQQITQKSRSNLDLNDAASPSKTGIVLSTTSPLSSQETIASSLELKDTLPLPLSPALHPQSQPPSPKLAHKDNKPSNTPAVDISFLPPLKHQSLVPPSKGKGPIPQQKSESRLFPLINNTEFNRSRSTSPEPSIVFKTDALRKDDSEPSDPASYLQEARKKTPAPAPNALKVTRPTVSTKNSNLRQSPLASGDAMPDKPFTKKFVECCSCKFYHDMPSKVYECMVNPDSFVEDRQLGVSGVIIATVKCPWCGHSMSKDCCSVYMAAVTLKEKLH